MLTEAQTSLHGNNRHGWGAVCEVNNWYLEKGRLAPQAALAERSQWHQRVWAFAGIVAQRSGRAVVVDDLRKGCYLFALGTLKSLTAFDNEDLDRTLNAFALLIDPDNLNAVKDRIAYE